MRGRRHRWLGLGVAALALLTSCGASGPVDDVPALGTSLERVDEAVVEGRYDDARTELEELVATTTSAQQDGDLEDPDADRILAAAAQLMSALPDGPGGGSTPEPEPSEPAEPVPSDPSGGDEGGGDTGRGSEGDGDSEEREQEELEKEQEKLEKEQERLEKDKEKG